MDLRVRLPGGLYRLAKEQAGGDIPLQRVIRRLLDVWTGTIPDRGLRGIEYCPDCDGAHRADERCRVTELGIT